MMDHGLRMIQDGPMITESKLLAMELLTSVNSGSHLTNGEQTTFLLPLTTTIQTGKSTLKRVLNGSGELNGEILTHGRPLTTQLLKMSSLSASKTKEDFLPTILAPLTILH